MPNTVPIPASAIGVRKKLCRFSVSLNIYGGLVKPLVEDLFGDQADYHNTSTVQDLLVEIHKCFWHSGGTPLPYPGAVAGHFQELMFAFKHAQKEDGRTVKVGAEGQPGQVKSGGDVSQVLSDGRIKTYQFKVSKAANPTYIKEHINKAGAQLTGQTGELPVNNSINVIYMICQDTQAFENYGSVDWRLLIEEALSFDYVSDHGPGGRTVVSGAIKGAVNRIKIVTGSTRWRFDNQNGVVTLKYFQQLSGDNVKYFATEGSKFETHWAWLRGTWWPANVDILANKATVIAATKEHGLAATNKPNTFPEIPKQ
jgi:hypothetical protein